MSQNYATVFNIMVSPFDMKFKFKAIEPDLQEDGTIIADKTESVADVTLPIPVAKQFAKRLNEAIENYEKQIGAIIDVDAVQNNFGGGSV